MKKVHFLHIPKTAGQSVHNLLDSTFDSVSPLRLNSQYSSLGESSIKEYDVISGHIDWRLMEKGGDAEFTFTILRKPIDRILSFYHYLRKEALKLDDNEINKPERQGMKLALQATPDEYFSPKNNQLKNFIDDHYDNFYCYYFASKIYSGHSELKYLSKIQIINKAISNISNIDKIYDVSEINRLPKDLKDKFTLKNISSIKHINKGDSLTTEERLYQLEKIGPSEIAKRRISEMCELDNILYDHIFKIKM